MHLVGVEDSVAVDGNLLVMSRSRAAGDDEVIAVHHARSHVADYLDLVIVNEVGVALEHSDTISAQLRLDDLDLAGHDGIGAEDQVLHRDLVFDGIAAAVKRALAQAAEVKHCLAKGFARNCAGIDAHATNGALALDHGDLLAHLGGADSGFLSRRAASDDDEVVRIIAAYGVVHRSQTSPLAVCGVRLSCQESESCETKLPSFGPQR